MPSESSSSDCPLAFGGHCFDHGPKCCHCGFTPPEPAHKKCAHGEHPFKPFQGPKDEPGKPHCLTCGHVWGECSWHWVDEPERIHKWKACLGCGHPRHPEKCRELTTGDPNDMDECGCLGLTHSDDIAQTCRSAGGCPLHPEEERSGEAPESLLERCSCKHLRRDHHDPSEGSAHCGGYGYLCLCFGFEAEAPPLTPEEEEEVEPECKFPGGCHRVVPCSPGCGAEPAPPQPLRRPPYAVAYSVGGHLYEVALPGDATVQAVDGALIIQHALGPVAGITQVLPIESKEASNERP